jgi:hypothetical protein
MLLAHLYMGIVGQKLKKQSNNYFNSIVFFFRLAGVPLKMNKMSTIYAVYMMTVMFCSSSTLIGLIVGVYEHRDDLGHIMTSMRVLMPLMNVIIIYAYCR